MMLAVDFFLNFLLYPFVINLFRKKQFGEYIRKEGPDLHNYKEGTPTMGGIVFVLTSVFFGFLMKVEPVFLLSILTFFTIGLLDDMTSIRKKRAEGLFAKQKLLFQILASILILFLIDVDTSIDVFGKKLEIGFWYYVFAVLVIVGSSNAMNLTDGLDGLAGWVFLSGAIPYWFFLKTRGIDEKFLPLVCAGVLAFLVFNSKPAKIFMGDTGALALGGFIGTVAVVTKTEFYLLLFFPIIVLETVSVMLQVTSYKLFKKRVFKMAPLHHHFELLGWKEEKVVGVFTAFNLISALVALEITGVVG